MQIHLSLKTNKYHKTNTTKPNEARLFLSSLDSIKPGRFHAKDNLWPEPEGHLQATIAPIQHFKGNELSRKFFE